VTLETPIDSTIKHPDNFPLPSLEIVCVEIKNGATVTGNPDLHDETLIVDLPPSLREIFNEKPQIKRGSWTPLDWPLIFEPFKVLEKKQSYIAKVVRAIVTIKRGEPLVCFKSDCRKLLDLFQLWEYEIHHIDNKHEEKTHHCLYNLALVHSECNKILNGERSAARSIHRSPRKSVCEIDSSRIPATEALRGGSDYKKGTSTQRINYKTETRARAWVMLQIKRFGSIDWENEESDLDDVTNRGAEKVGVSPATMKRHRAKMIKSSFLVKRTDSFEQDFVGARKPNINRFLFNVIEENLPEALAPRLIDHFKILVRRQYGATEYEAFLKRLDAAMNGMLVIDSSEIKDDPIDEYLQQLPPEIKEFLGEEED